MPLYPSSLYNNICHKMRYMQIFAFFVFMVMTSCRNDRSSGSKEIIIFHAGSLSVPFRQLAKEYEKRNPGTKILMEPAGSLVCARKVTELKKPCDIVASADYFVINELLIPDYTKWSISFATNEMVIAFNEKSNNSGEINPENWMDIISEKNVIYSRSDPDSDPGGYRTVFVIKLSEKYYKLTGLADRLLAKDVNFIRPKEVDLIALLETHAVDYIFVYKSVALQHRLKYINLPSAINLSDPEFNDVYHTVSLDVTGNTAGSKIQVTGDYINYSLTVIENAPHKEAALDFTDFILSSDGMEILRNCGQNPIIPPKSEQPDKIPERLLKYLNEPQLQMLK
jgi:molybdate/tungstate transport system substrate-binding protein